MRLAKDGQRNCYRPRNEDESKAWFWERVIKRGPDECWEWIGSVDGWGYGQMRYNGGHKRVHRLSLMWAGGLPELNNQSVLVLHSCDNKRCVNPRHLHLGDDKQNMREAIERGLWQAQRGSKHGMAQLTETQVMCIRALYMPRRITAYILSKLFRVCPGTIKQIIYRTIWRHV